MHFRIKNYYNTAMCIGNVTTNIASLLLFRYLNILYLHR